MALTGSTVRLKIFCVGEQPTPTPSVTASVTPTISQSPTPSVTSSITPTATVTASVTRTVTPSISQSVTPTRTATVTPSVTPTRTATVTPTASVTPSITASVTPTMTATVTPTASVTPTITASVTPTRTATVTPTASVTASVTPSATSAALIPTGMTAWYKSDAGVTTNGTTVTQWADQSGNNYHLTGTTFNGPTLTGDKLIFNGSHVLSNPSITINSMDVTVVMVTKKTTTGNTVMYEYSDNANSPGAGGGFAVYTRDTFGYDLAVSNIGGQHNQQGAPYENFVNYDGIWVVSYNQSDNYPENSIDFNDSFYNNTTNIGAETTTGQYGSNPFYLGGRAGTQYFSSFETREFIIYNRKLTSEERTQVKNYLKNKYSLTITPTPTVTPTASVTPGSSVTPTASVTPTVTPSVTPTQTASITPTATVTASVTPTRTATVTPSVTATNTPTTSVTPTRTTTVTPSLTASVTATATITPSITASVTPTLTASVSATATITPSITPTMTATVTPSGGSQSCVVQVSDSYTNITPAAFATSIGTGGNTTELGQVFGALVAGPIEYAKFYGAKVGTPSGSVYARLYSTNEFAPGSYEPLTLLATSDSLNMTSFPTSDAWITFTFSGANKVNLSQNTIYVITIYTEEPVSGSYIYVKEQDTFNIDGHVYHEVYNGGGFWSVGSSYDVLFEVGVCGVPPTPTPTASVTASVTPSITVSPTTGTQSFVSYSRTMSTGGVIDTNNKVAYTTGSWTESPLPFPFTFYDRTYTGFTINRTGRIMFDLKRYQEASLSLPNNDWGTTISVGDDNYNGNSTGTFDYNGQTLSYGLYTSVTGTAPNRVYNIEWRYFHEDGNTRQHIELRLYETTNKIEMVYGSINTQYATVGIQNYKDGKILDYDLVCFATPGVLTTGDVITYERIPAATPTPTPTQTKTPTPTLTNGATPTVTPTLSPSVNENVGNPQYTYSYKVSTGGSIPAGATLATSYGSGDEGQYPVRMPFNFRFYGRDFAFVGVSSNGQLWFDWNSWPANVNTALPELWDTYGPVMMPLWDDLYASGTNTFNGVTSNCGYYHITTGVAPYRVYTIEFRLTKQSTGAPQHFAVSIHETTNKIEYIYQDVDTYSATIGMQGSDFLPEYNEHSYIPSSFVQYSFDTEQNFVPGTVITWELVDGLAPTPTNTTWYDVTPTPSQTSNTTLGYTRTISQGASFITATHELTAGSGTSQQVMMPFGVRINGVERWGFYALAAGYLQFFNGQGISYAWDNTQLPWNGGTTANTLTLFPLWDFQSNNPSVGGGVFYEFLGEAPNRQVVVEWRSQLSGRTDVVKFEVVIHENGNIDYIYGDPIDTSTATIGMQRGVDFVDQVSFNTAGAVVPGTKISWVPAILPPTPTPTPTLTPTVTPTVTRTVTPTITPTRTVTPSITPSNSLVTLTQTDTSGAITMTQNCANITTVAATASSRTATIGGTAGTSLVAVTVGAGQTGAITYADRLTIPATATWDAGTWTWNLNIISANMNLVLNRVLICRVNSSGVSQATIGDSGAINLSLGSAGVFSGNITGTAQTPAAGDRVHVFYLFNNTSTMSTQSTNIEPDQTYITPFRL